MCRSALEDNFTFVGDWFVCAQINWATYLYNFVFQYAMLKKCWTVLAFHRWHGTLIAILWYNWIIPLPKFLTALIGYLTVLLEYNDILIYISEGSGKQQAKWIGRVCTLPVPTLSMPLINTSDHRNVSYLYS